MKKKNKLKITIFIILILFLVYIISVFVISIFSFNNLKLNNDIGYQGNDYNWNSTNTINVLVVYESKVNNYYLNTYNSIMSIDPSGQVAFLNIPDNMKIATSSNTYQKLNTIYPLGDLNSNKNGMNDLLKYLRYSLALPIQGYISFSSSGIKGLNVSIYSNIKYKNIIKNGENNLNSKQMNYILSIKTDNNSTLYLKNLIFNNLLFSFVNPISLINYKSRVVAFKNLFYSNINSKGFSNLLIDFYKIGINNIKYNYLPYSNKINLTNTDNYIQSNFTDNTFSNSGVSVQILDASNSNFAVYQFSRYIQNLGGNISSIGIYNSNTYKDIIFVGNLSKYGYEVNVIKDILGPNNVIIKDNNPNFFYTGTIIVVLGQVDNYIY